MTDKDTYAKLRAYSDELGLDPATRFITIEDLIDSHRYLRNIHIVTNEMFNQITNDCRAKGYEDGYVKAIDREFISIERLKRMSVLEFADFIKD